MTRGIAYLVVCMTGFVALSWEIVWYRVYAYVSRGSPASFGVLLGAYLLGIALGSAASRGLCRDGAATGRPEQVYRIALFVFLAEICGFLTAPKWQYGVCRRPRPRRRSSPASR